MTYDSIILSTRLTRADVAGLIEALVEDMKEGCLKIQKSDSNYTLDVPRVVDLDIEAGEKGDRTVFRIEVSWRTNPPEIPDETETSASYQKKFGSTCASSIKTTSILHKTVCKTTGKRSTKNISQSKK